jgi:D-glycero-D-manno-heptose 1,7-bisphosphate phosphatase
MDTERLKPAIFLDRDDTLIDTARATAHTPAPGDLIDLGLVRVLPGVVEACARLVGAGFVLVVVTNQGGLAAGTMRLAEVEAVHDRLRSLIPSLGPCYLAPARPGGTVARFNAHPEWRKPSGEMLRIAARELGLNLSRSWMIGDAERDPQAGIAAGLAPERCLRIGEGARWPDLASAAKAVLRGGLSANLSAGLSTSRA